MIDWSKRFAANKSEGTVLVLFIPSADRNETPIADQDFWVTESLELLGKLFGGATAFPQGRGVWRDDQREKRLVFDKPVIIQSYTSRKAIDENADEVRAFLVHMGQETRQGAVGIVIDRKYIEIEILPTKE